MRQGRRHTVGDAVVLLGSMRARRSNSRTAMCSEGQAKPNYRK
jgi:hypothetical protein